MNERSYDYLIIGAGIMGMTIAHALKKRDPETEILIMEKEAEVAHHASGRNSGVLHAGFYYDSDSLKARFTVEGNRMMKAFCRNHDIPVNETGKVVVACNESEVETLHELKQRADVNGVELELIDEERLHGIDPNVRTYKAALFSPSTASVDPKTVCLKLKEILQTEGVQFAFSTQFDPKKSNVSHRYLVNTAGLYADRIAQAYGLAKRYTLLPFKGIYFKYLTDKTAIKTNVYPVPHKGNAFLGVHYTVTSDHSIKIGPTAIPAFWRENYQGFTRFNIKELGEILYYEFRLFVTNAFGFRQLALEEMKNYNMHHMVTKARKMLYSISDAFAAMPAGIRAQLLDTKTNRLVTDFVIEHTAGSTHVLNAVSPAFTCSFAFAEYVADEIERNRSHNE